ncbi:MAG TPA: type II toxin-antitoxin system HicB family antitoxin [Acetobacteraceae bacterium]|nr:type II toxin-antitoxin system HicB family antitoxin [Acetobacteraceae bacterium]
MLTIDTEREDEGRWFAEITALPGVMAYGSTEAEARQKAAALAFRVIAERLEHGEPVPDEARSLFVLA